MAYIMPELVTGKIVSLSPRIQRLLAPNPGVMPGTGTNTYFVGDNHLALIDPGPMMDEHIRMILNEKRKHIRWILITHAHPDHYPAADIIKAETGAPICAFGSTPAAGRSNALKPDRMLGHNECIADEHFTLRAIHTPGHASDHLCYLLEEEKILFTGDQIMNGSTVVIAPPDGDMAAYLHSLNLLKTYPIELLAPGHGDLMSDPVGVIDGLIAHRLNRENKVITALKEMGPAPVEKLVPPVYDDVPVFLHPIAKFSLLAHLIKLEAEKKSSRSEGIWRWTG